MYILLGKLREQSRFQAKQVVLQWATCHHGFSSPVVPLHERIDYNKTLVFRGQICLQCTRPSLISYSILDNLKLSNPPICFILSHSPFGPLLPLISLSLSHMWFQVKVQLEASSLFLAVPGEKEHESHCICGNGRQTVSWAVTPKSLGEGQSPRNYSILFKDCISLESLYPVLLPSGNASFTPTDGRIFFFVLILGCLEDISTSLTFISTLNAQYHYSLVYASSISAPVFL